MKTIALVSLCFVAAQALTCSTSGSRGSPPKKCPSGMRCKITYQGRPEVDIPNHGTCVKTATTKKTKPKYSANYNKAYAAFNAADKDHSGTITFGGAYQALSKLFPHASEQTLDHLTKTADKAHYDSSKHKYVFRDGKIDKSEFITMYLSLLRQQQHGSSNACKNSNPCGYGQTCYLCKNTKGYCCKKIVTVGPTEKPNGGLTKTEMAHVTNLFQAMNTQKSSKNGALSNEYLTYSELFAFMKKVGTTFGTRSNFYHQVTNIIFRSDKDHNSRVSFKEFVNACATLKKSDPKDFQKFLSVAESQHMLPVGSSCVPTGSTKCAKGSSCLPTSQPRPPQTFDGPPQTFDGDRQFHADGHLMIPENGAALGGGRKLKAVPSYKNFRYTSYKCQVRPTSCEACVKNHGKWFGKHCLMSGDPMVYDAPLTTTVKACRKKKAMDKAKCSQHKSCGQCTAHGKSTTFGQLCAWASYGSNGNCVQNSGGYWGMARPMITSQKMCNSDVVHVHG